MSYRRNHEGTPQEIAGSAAGASGGEFRRQMRTALTARGRTARNRRGRRQAPITGIRISPPRERGGGAGQ